MPKSNTLVVVTFIPDDLDRAGTGEDNSVVIGAFKDASDENVLAVLTAKHIDDPDYEEFRFCPREEDLVEIRNRDGDDDEWEDWTEFGYVKYDVTSVI